MIFKTIVYVNITFKKYTNSIKNIISMFPRPKVMSATFLLVCFSSLKEGNCETWKNYFTSKALFVLKKMKF